MTPPLCQKVKKRSKSEESEEESKKKKKKKTGLKLIIQKTKIIHHDIWSHHVMANRWGNNGNNDRLYFLGLQINADGDCSHEIKRCLLLGGKAITT